MESMLGTIVAAVLLVGAVEGAHVAYVEAQDSKVREEMALHQEAAREGELANVEQTVDALLAQAQRVAGAVTLYAGRHGGRYPENLNVLHEEGLLQAPPSVSPSLGGAPFYLIKSEAGKYSLRLPIRNPVVCVAVDKVSGVTNADSASPYSLDMQHSHSPYSCYGSLELQTFTFDL